MQNRSGSFVLNLSGEAQYRSFCPAPLPPSPPVMLDEETIAGAMKNYAASEQKDLNLLAEYAQKFKVFSEVKRYLEVLL